MNQTTTPDSEQESTNMVIFNEYSRVVEDFVERIGMIDRKHGTYLKIDLKDRVVFLESPGIPICTKQWYRDVNIVEFVLNNTPVTQSL